MTTSYTGEVTKVSDALDAALKLLRDVLYDDSVSHSHLEEFIEVERAAHAAGHADDEDVQHAIELEERYR